MGRADGGGGERVMKVMVYLLLAVITIVCGIGWLTADISVKALIRYMEIKEYTLPTAEDVAACTRWVVRRKISRKP